MLSAKYLNLCRHHCYSFAYQQIILHSDTFENNKLKIAHSVRVLFLFLCSNLTDEFKNDILWQFHQRERVKESLGSSQSRETGVNEIREKLEIWTRSLNDSYDFNDVVEWRRTRRALHAREDFSPFRATLGNWISSSTPSRSMYFARSSRKRRRCS